MKNTMTGNRALLKIGGKIVGGGVQTADFNDDLGLQKVSGLGSAEPQELVNGEVSHTFSLSSYFVSGKNLQQEGFVPGQTDYLTSGELEIEIIDNITGETLEHYTGCKAGSHSRSYSKHTITGQNASFQALTKLK